MNALKIALVVGLLIVPISAAQLKVDVQLVNIVATVTDERGRYVADLTADDFIVREDGNVQKISNLSQSTDLPVSMGVVLDSSGSMERKMSTATNAVERFIRTIHRDDDIFLMTFSSRPTLEQPFTHDRGRLVAALRRVVVGGDTALYDAVDESLKTLRAGQHPKKAILLITDGNDTTSYINVEEALRDIRESEMLVYSLGISPSDSGLTSPIGVPVGTPPIIVEDPTGRRSPTIGLPPTTPRIPGGSRIPVGIPFPGGPQIPGGRGTPPSFPGSTPLMQRQRLPGGTTITVADSVDMDVLDRFAEASGGKSWLLSPSWTNNRGNEINRVLDEIASELRNQYSIDYYPSHSIKDGKWHRIEIEAKDPRYHVRARKEYFGR